MKEQLISVIVALTFSLIGVILSEVWSNEFRLVDSLYFGLFAYLTTNSAIILYYTLKLKDFDKIEKKIRFIANHLCVQESLIKRGTRTFDIFWSLSLLRAKEGIYNLLETGDFIVSREQIPNFWLQAIINTDSSWLSTNVVNSEQDWKSGWENKGLLYQKNSIELSNISIRRIFIFESKGKINEEMKLMMFEHQSNNIQVKWLSKDSNNMYWASFQSIESRIKTTDFVIVDNNYLLSFDLNKENIMNYVKCSRDEGLVSDISSLYMRLWEQSNYLDDL